jgi:SET domain-containing protein
VYTLIPLPLHAPIGDYEGELLTKDEKDRRYLPSRKNDRTKEDERWLESRKERGQTAKGDYIFGVGDVYVDAEDTECGNWARYLNHDNAPNLRVKSLEVGMDGRPRVWFVANRDIEEGEELCFDYGEGYWMEGDVVA